MASFNRYFLTGMPQLNVAILQALSLQLIQKGKERRSLKESMSYISPHHHPHPHPIIIILKDNI